MSSCRWWSPAASSLRLHPLPPVMLISLLRYALVMEKHQNCVLNTAGLSAGWICAAGLIMVGNFQVTSRLSRPTSQLSDQIRFRLNSGSVRSDRALIHRVAQNGLPPSQYIILMGQLCVKLLFFSKIDCKNSTFSSGYFLIPSKISFHAVVCDERKFRRTIWT